jgi:hypothetical protein
MIRISDMDGRLADVELCAGKLVCRLLSWIGSLIQSSLCAEAVQIVSCTTPCRRYLTVKLGPNTYLWTSSQAQTTRLLSPTDFCRQA